MKLTKSEASILLVLTEHYGTVVSPEQLVVEALGYANPGTTADSMIHMHVLRMRRKGLTIGNLRDHGYYLGTLPEKPTTIERECQWCGRAFIQQRAAHRYFVYCELHRGQAVRKRYFYLKNRK